MASESFNPVQEGDLVAFVFASMSDHDRRALIQALAIPFPDLVDDLAQQRS